MAIKDIRSNLLVLPSIAVVTGNGTTNGTSIDTANNELGLMFAVGAFNYTDGTYNFVLEESDTGAFAGEETAVPVESLIGTLAGLALTAASITGVAQPTIGVFSNLRFVRLNTVATGVTTGADVITSVIQKAETMPVD